MSRYTLGEEKYPGLFVVLDNGTPTEAVASEKASLGDRAEITGGVFRGGVFRGGVFRGGVFRGGWFHDGVFHDGVFHDGVFHGGWFHDGVFHDGVFHGGVFHGGVFHGGVFRGGWFHGGVFRGGWFRGGWFHDGVFHDGWLPVQIQGSMAFINCPDGKTIRIGCQNHTPEYWAENYASIGKIHGYTDEQIIEYKGYIDLVSAMIQRSNAS